MNIPRSFPGAKMNSKNLLTGLPVCATVYPCPRKGRTKNQVKKKAMSQNTIQTVSTVSHSAAAEVLAAAGIELAPGDTMPVDITLNLSGTISKGMDTEASATVKTLSVASVACLLRCMGATREAGLAQLLAIAGGSLQPTEADEAFAAEFKRRVAAELPPMPVSGRRTGKLVVTAIS